MSFPDLSCHQKSWVERRGVREWESATSSTSGVAQLTPDYPAPVTIIDLREEISTGQRVARHTIEGLIGGEWQQLAGGTTIGYRRLHRIERTVVTALRLRLDETIDQPLPVAIRAWG